MKWLLKFWDFAIATLVAVCFAAWIAPDVWRAVTSELITFFSIQAAAVLPAMIFTAGFLRPEGVTISEAKRYQKALRGQMIFWIVLLALDFLSAVLLIVGKAASWSWIVSIPDMDLPYDLSWLLSGIIALFVSLAMLRTIPFVRGVLSLLELNGELAVKAIKKQNKAEAKVEAGESQPYKKPKDFGRVTTRH